MTAKKAAAKKTETMKAIEAAASNAKKPVASKSLKAVTPVEAPVAKKAAKKKPLKFDQLWREDYDAIHNYVNTAFETDDAARLYIDLAEFHAPQNIRLFTADILRQMQDETGLDVARAFRIALISYNLDQLSAEDMQTVLNVASQASVKNWRAQISLASEEMLEDLENEGVYLLEGSPLEIDEHQQPPKKKPVVAFAEGDEILDVFDKKSLLACPQLAADYDQNMRQVNYDEYDKIADIAAFRAMYALWPHSFRHHANVNTASGRRVTWTVITELFRAVVSEERVEVILGDDESGYSYYAKVDGFEAGFDRVFAYFNTLSSDQLEGALRTVGFSDYYVAGVKFDVVQGELQKPGAFVVPCAQPIVEIFHSANRLHASDFLMLAAQTTRGIHFEREDTHGKFDEYELILSGDKFRVMYLDNEVYSGGPLKGVASLTEHADQLQRTAHLAAHGAHLDDNNVLQLPVSAEAVSNFHPEDGVKPDHDNFYMTSVTFV